jgi:hypothetical protein
LVKLTWNATVRYWFGLIVIALHHRSLLFSRVDNTGRKAIDENHKQWYAP